MTSSSNNEQEEEMTKPAVAGAPHSFNERWDSVSKHAIQSTSTDLAVSHSILDNLRLRRGSETAKWLNTLESEISHSSLSPVSNSSGTASVTLLQPYPATQSGSVVLDEQAMIDKAIRGLDKIFDEFELYAFQFNHTAQGTDFVVSYTRPIKNLNNDGICVSYAGNLSTRLWAMVVRGCASKVEVYVVPAELLLAFSIHTMGDSGYKPLLTVEAEWSNGEPIWHIEKTIITIEQIPMLAKELFGDLIRIATGQMSEAELFAHPKQEFALGKNLAVGYQANPAAVTSTNATASPNTLPTANNPAFANNTSTSTKSSLSLASIAASEQLLVLVNQDINQLLELGKTVLQSDNSASFEKIKVLTEKMEALKTAISIALTNVRQAVEQIDSK